MSEWISIKDKEISENIEVLVYGKSYGDSFISVCSISHFTRPTDGEHLTFVHVPMIGGYEFEVDFNFKDITHWMPLPDFPKDES